MKIKYGLLILLSIIGLSVSMLLSIDKLELLKNPNFVPPCAINSVFNCLSVMKSEYSSIFYNIPNPWFGLIGYTAVLVYSVMTLAHNSTKRAFEILFAIGSIGAFVFSYYLLSHSVLDLQVMCPYCLVSCFCATNIAFIALSEVLKKKLLIHTLIWHLVVVAVLIFKFY